MNTQVHPLALEARFGQLAAALGSGAEASDAACKALLAQARLALRGVDALVHSDETARLIRSAARLARRLAGSGGKVANVRVLEQFVLQLGIEMGRRLDPILIAETLRSVLNGRAELSTFGAADDDPADTLASLFTQLALVAAVMRARLP